MKEVILLMEYVINEKTRGTNYNVRLRKSTGGNLPKRAPFIRQVMRQTSLYEFMPTAIGDIIPVPEVTHDKDVIYTIHPRELKDEKVLKIYNMILQDLDEYIRKHR